MPREPTKDSDPLAGVKGNWYCEECLRPFPYDPLTMKHSGIHYHYDGATELCRAKIIQLFSGPAVRKAMARCWRVFAGRIRSEPCSQQDRIEMWAIIAEEADEFADLLEKVNERVPLEVTARLKGREAERKRPERGGGGANK